MPASPARMLALLLPTILLLHRFCSASHPTAPSDQWLHSPATSTNLSSSATAFSAETNQHDPPHSQQPPLGLYNCRLVPPSILDALQRWEELNYGANLGRNGYVIFNVSGTSGGLADRLKGLSTVFMIAVLTNRTLGIHWESPDRLSDHLGDGDLVPWTSVNASAVDAVHIGGFNEFLDGDLLLDRSRYLSVRCSRMQIDEWSRDGLTVKPWQAWHVPENDARSLRLDRSLACWMQLLFKPKPSIESTLESYRVRLGSKKLFCVQLRTGDGRSTYFLDTKDSALDRVIDGIAAMDLHPHQWCLFITSDKTEVLRRMLSEFPDHCKLTNPSSSVHIDLNRTIRATMAMPKVIAEFYQFQSCHTSVVTGLSGFGNLGLWMKPDEDYWRRCFTLARNGTLDVYGTVTYHKPRRRPAKNVK